MVFDIQTIRRSPIVPATALMAMGYAFNQLKIKKLKIEFNHTNKAVKGFCWHFGFVKRSPILKMILPSKANLLMYWFIH